MTKKTVVFRLLAYTDAAGKFNAEAPLNGNEDNFYVDDDLCDTVVGRCEPDQDVTMSEGGCLMVVADGMGGMNAGEVASEMAILTVKEYFAPGKITPKTAASHESRKHYLEAVIKEADQRIKTASKENPNYAGMGTTIILAWIVGHQMTISWCGDSRAYRYNPVNGLELLSCDHSYVQELVNDGVLRYEDTFEHPQGNLITRSLGEPDRAAQSETRQFEVYNQDMILLCSDGLNGVLRDRKTKDHSGNYYPGENIEDILAAHTHSLVECKEALMSAAERADWYDNVTVLLCKMVSGAPPAIKHSDKEVKPSGFSVKNTIKESFLSGIKKTKCGFLKKPMVAMCALCVVLLLILCGLLYHRSQNNPSLKMPLKSPSGKSAVEKSAIMPEPESVQKPELMPVSNPKPNPESKPVPNNQETTPSQDTTPKP